MGLLRYRRIAFFFLTLSLPIPALAGSPTLTGEAAIAPDELMAHVRHLASDALQGRLAGTPGADSAAAYIARQFSACGLEPVGDDGTYYQYHRPSDDVEKINAGGMAKIVNFIFRLAWDTADRLERPAFVRTKPGKQQIAARGFRVYLGTIPDYLAQVKGVRLTGVRAGSPADQGGIKGGDIIVRFGGRAIQNIYDYTYALQEHKPGDTVEVVALRNGKEIGLTVRLQKRQ